MKELQRGLNNILVDIAGNSREAGKALKEVLRDAAEPIKQDAIALAPFKTGRLRRAIFASRGDKSKSSAIVGVNHKIAPHAHLVEFGHAGPHPAPPHPFMRPAIEKNRASTRNIIANGVGDIIKKYK
jgi:HK97 gp10 family phage protein